MLESKRVSVWLIEGNDLKQKNKVIVKLNYKDTEIAVLKDDLDYNYQEFLIKKGENEYWALGIAPIKFSNFEKVIENPSVEEKSYCDDILKLYLNNETFKNFFEKKIKNEKWFNKCELEYISRYNPELYESAKQCREQVISKRNIEKQKEMEEKIKNQNEEVEKVNSIFEKKLQDIKYKIYTGADVPIDNLEFYKDGKYENGKTTQNSILYLARQYGIKIPLATQGFINNRLVNYNFRNGKFMYKLTSNKKASVEMHKYLRMILNCVKEEIVNSQRTKLNKVKGVR